ncbi:uncharacterized protein FYW61_018268 isoform 2-T2 [Anableps anableps]
MSDPTTNSSQAGTASPALFSSTFSPNATATSSAGTIVSDITAANDLTSTASFVYSFLAVLGFCAGCFIFHSFVQTFRAQRRLAWLDCLLWVFCGFQLLLLLLSLHIVVHRPKYMQSTALGCAALSFAVNAASLCGVLVLVLHGVRPHSGPAVQRPAEEAHGVRGAGEPDVCCDLSAAGGASRPAGQRVGGGALRHGPSPSRSCVRRRQAFSGCSGSLRPPGRTPDQRLRPAAQIEGALPVRLRGGPRVSDRHGAGVPLPAVPRRGAAEGRSAGPGRGGEPHGASLSDRGGVRAVLGQQLQPDAGAPAAPAESGEPPGGDEAAEGLLSEARPRSAQQEHHRPAHRDHRHAAGHGVIGGLVLGAEGTASNFRSNSRFPGRLVGCLLREPACRLLPFQNNVTITGPVLQLPHHGRPETLPSGRIQRE